MQKALFLYNPAAGRGRIARNVGGIVDIFSENGWELTPEKIDFGRNPFDAHPDIRMVVAAGGDGTVNYVVNRMRERGLSLELGIIPAGTANDFAGIVGMAKDPLEAARQIVTGEVQALDCGVVNGLHFVNIFSFGIFTTTSQRTPDERKHKIGKLAYIIEGVKEFRTMHAVPLEIEADDRDGLMLDVATILTSLRLRTSEMSARSVGGGTAIVCLRFGVHNLTELENVRTRLRGISGVHNVERGTE